MDDDIEDDPIIIITREPYWLKAVKSGGGASGGNGDSERGKDNGRTKGSGGGSYDYSKTSCVAGILDSLRKWAKSERGELGKNATSLVSFLLVYFDRMGDTTGIDAAFSIANAYHETNLFKEFTEPISEHSRRYDGGSPYRGRGFVHLTGEWNYQRYSKEAGVDLVKNPERAAEPRIALKIMTAYFATRGTFAALNRGDIVEARRTINKDEDIDRELGEGSGVTPRGRIVGLTTALMDTIKSDCVDN